ncbi:ArnT family glycosyltransferase [Rugamonas apoptosis]|uniref:Glycosyltransferase family 39 protein n=1 Tax=Rugamonas apoptosis TaxID=2758570 RepID=A0A7W2INB8_9BURK|nr:glycosyltransferase family 39 protein [Rugamonas apoptosis]MBA5690573.1 glycosyltransferase family 39 protein [Rugamonas apoptosis]
MHQSVVKRLLNCFAKGKADRYAISSNLSRGVQAYVVVVLVFTFSGLVGHDPWKADEAYVFGVVQHMYESSDWVVPMLAGEPFMEKPPLFYWMATAFASIFSHWLPLHDGARLASGFFMSVACWALGTTARIWWGAGMGRYAALILIACLGTLVQSHMMMPDLPLLASFAISALGFATILSRAHLGGFLLGMGVGIGFLSKGLLAPAVMVLTALLLPLCFEAWRLRAYWRGLLTAVVVSLPWCVIWPLVLYMRSPTLFMDWFWINNIGRFAGFSVPRLGTEHLPWFWSQTIPWFTFPGLPVALWMLWSRRHTALREPPIQYALVAFSVLMLVLATSSSARCIYAWPLMVPIAILAGPGACALPLQSERLWVGLSLTLFGVFSLIIWTGWVSMMSNGVPPNWPYLLRLLPVEFVPRFSVLPIAAAVLVTLAALLALWMFWRRPARGLAIWVVGVTLSWSLLTTLWMPWLDFAKSYRSVFVSMPIPAHTNCIASIGLGEGERAMLRYFTGRDPVRREISPAADCTVLLVQREAVFGEPDIDPSRWRELWRGSRPGITNERFWLFQRERGASSRLTFTGHTHSSPQPVIDKSPTF